MNFIRKGSREILLKFFLYPYYLLFLVLSWSPQAAASIKTPSDFARSNRVFQIPAIFLENKARQSKIKTRLMFRLYSFSHNKTKSFIISFEKKNQSKKSLEKPKKPSHMKHYIKVWRLLFDVCLSHVERGELLI